MPKIKSINEKGVKSVQNKKYIIYNYLNYFIIF